MNRMMHAGLLFLLLLSGLPGRAAREAIPSIEEPTRHLERQVLIPFRIWDAGNREYVTDPTRIRLQDFRIRENSKEQVPLAVDLERRPLSLALVVDISGSMEESLPSVRLAARQLGQRLGPQDRVAVLSFNREVVLRSDPTSHRQVLRRNLAELHTWGFTAVYDAIHEALETLKHEADPRAIIVLTDGGDNRSSHSMEEVADHARRAKIPLFFICHKVDPAGFRELLEAADETGGRVFRSMRDQDFLWIFGTIADGLRNTFILAYRPSEPPDDLSWRSLKVKHKTKRWKIDTWKTGYGARPPEEDATDLAVLETGIEPGPPARLTVRGWVDVGHDMGAMVHPTRYGEDEPIPNNPRRIDLKYWPFHRTDARPDEISLLLPAPEALPRSPGRFWESMLSTGATFLVTGMEETQPSRYRPTVRQFTIPPVPGLAGPVKLGGPQQIWWTDGRIALGFRDAFSRSIFHLMPEYRRWVEIRFGEATEKAVRLEVQAALSRVREEIPEEVRAGLASMVEENVRNARRSDWAEIVSGATGPTARLLPRRADMQAADFLARADAVLVDRLLAGPPPDPESLETDWLGPARTAWSRLRTFFSPFGHQSLMAGIPFLDDPAGEIYLQRVILPWVESNAGERRFGRFPPTAPTGLEAVAGLLRNDPIRAALVGGKYRCDEHGVSVTPGFSRQAEQKPTDWLLQVEALQAEKSRLREIRRRLGPQDGAWIREEEQVLNRELRALRRTDGDQVEIRLDRTGAPGVGLRLFREGNGSVHAGPLRDPGFVLEADGPEQLTDLPTLAVRNGADRSDPAVVNAILAARINGLDGAALAEMLSPGGPAGCASGLSYDTIRLRFSDSTPGATSPVRLLRKDGTEVLELNLAGVSAAGVQDGLAALCRPEND